MNLISEAYSELHEIKHRFESGDSEIAMTRLDDLMSELEACC